MQSAGSIKLGISFLAGVVLALGGAFIYLKATDNEVQPAPKLAAQTVVVEPLPLETAPAPPNNEPVKLPVGAHSQAPVIRTRRPVSLALSRRAPLPVPQPVPQTAPAPVLELPPPDMSPVQPAAQPGSVPEAFPVLKPAPQPHTVTIPAGTNLTVRLNESLSTEHNYSGDTFRATLDTPIIMNGFIIADRGAKVLGRVAKAQKPGKMQGMAELSLVLTEIATTDGQRMLVETSESLRKGASNTNEEVIKMAGGAALGAIIGAIAGGGKGAAIGAGAGGAAGTGAVLLGHGKPAVIQNETRLTFEMAAAATITEHIN